MLHCMACDEQMSVTYNEHGELNDLCNTCLKKRVVAEAMDGHEFEGLWSDTHWIELGGTPLAPKAAALDQR